MFAKKRFLLLIGAALVIAGMRLLDNGVLSSGLSGVYTVYSGGVETVYTGSDVPFLENVKRYEYTRLDTDGSFKEAEYALKNLSAKELWREEVEGITVIYAYSPYISRYETIKGRRVNIMTAIRPCGKLAIGCPLLKGSY